MATQLALLQVAGEEFQQILAETNFTPVLQNVSKKSAEATNRNRRRGRDGSFIKRDLEDPEKEEVSENEVSPSDGRREGSSSAPHPSLQVYKQHKAFHSGEECFLPGVYAICSFVHLSAGRTRFRSITVNDMQVTESPFVIACRMLQQGGRILSQNSSPAGMSADMRAREQCVFHSLIIEISATAKRLNQ